MARKPPDTVQLKLRFSERLRRRLEREAARNNRSMNTEIIHRLQRTFSIDDSTAATNMLDFFRSLGVNITEANERDVAVAIGNAFGRWMPLQLKPAKSEDDGEKK
jgi:predicted type IV restriction endonuclease